VTLPGVEDGVGLQVVAAAVPLTAVAAAPLAQKVSLAALQAHSARSAARAVRPAERTLQTFIHPLVPLK